MKDLQEMLESSGDDEGLKSLAREEERSCYIEVERIQVSFYWSVYKWEWIHDLPPPEVYNTGTGSM